MVNGIVNVYKEPGFTSHDVVAKLRGITHQKKIGHTGTLDPAAEGVLPVAFGAATRICDMLADETKEYEAVLLLGVTTDTLDTTGTVLCRSDVNVKEEDVRKSISHYVGEIMQIPPMYSARKVNGQKLYDLARKGKEVEREARKVTIFSIEIKEILLPRVTMSVTCSKGTYIRTLCDDIGRELGCGGAMEHLIRTRVGRFKVSEAHRLSEIEETVRNDGMGGILLSPMEMFADMPVFVPNERGRKMALNGNVIPSDCHEGTLSQLTDGGRVRVASEEGFFYGIYEFDEAKGLYRPCKMFLC